ncbi:MAG: alpha/beta hydrolase [Gammaproteobacteria bacterium]
MTDLHARYREAMDDEVWSFIERTYAFYPQDAVERSIEEQRALYDRLAEHFNSDYPPGISARNETLSLDELRIPVRYYARVRSHHAASTGSPAATLIYYHGGGFVLGGLESHDSVCAELCMASGFEVVSVDYRLCPEHPHPAPFDDALAAFRTIAGAAMRPIVLGGDSAGANLAAAVAQATKHDDVTAVAQVLIYPGLGGDMTRGSYVEHANAPLLSTADIEYYHHALRGDGPTAAPLRARNFSGLPPTAVFSAKIDPLRDDGRDYVDALTAAGVHAVWHCEDGLPHGYLRARHVSQRASASFDRICAAVRKKGVGGE